MPTQKHQMPKSRKKTEKKGRVLRGAPRIVLIVPEDLEVAVVVVIVQRKEKKRGNANTGKKPTENIQRKTRRGDRSFRKRDPQKNSKFTLRVMTFQWREVNQISLGLIVNHLVRNTPNRSTKAAKVLKQVRAEFEKNSYKLPSIKNHSSVFLHLELCRLLS